MYILLYVLCFFIYKKKHHTARLTLIISSAIFLSILNYLNGLSVRSESMYIMLIISSLYFFSRKTTIIVISFIVASFVAVLYLVSNDAPYAGIFNRPNHYNYLIYSTLTIVALTIKMITENEKYNAIMQSQNASLVEINNELRRYNHIISHDLKEPIRSIVSFSNLLKRNTEKQENREEYLDYIISSGKQLNSLIEDIAMFQRLSTVSFKTGEINIENLVKGIKKSINKSNYSSNYSITHDGLTNIISSKTGLYLILNSLIENGLKYNNSDQPAIHIDIQEDKDFYQISIFLH